MILNILFVLQNRDLPSPLHTIIKHIIWRSQTKKRNSPNSDGKYGTTLHYIFARSSHNNTAKTCKFYSSAAATSHDLKAPVGVRSPLPCNQDHPPADRTRLFAPSSRSFPDPIPVRRRPRLVGVIRRTDCLLPNYGPLIVLQVGVGQKSDRSGITFHEKTMRDWRKVQFCTWQSIIKLAQKSGEVDSQL